MLVDDSLLRSGAMAGKFGSDLQELRALLAEVKALREDVERGGAEHRSGWGVSADKSKIAPQMLNLSRYIALRAHDLTDLQHRLAARGLSSLGRSESHVALALDTLIATLKRLTGEAGAPYPAPGLAMAGATELEAEADRLFGKRQDSGPRARVMATLPPEAATEPKLVDRLVAAGMDCARINCAHDDPQAWAQMVETCAKGRGASRASLPGADGYRRPEVPHPQSEGAAENAPRARRPDRSGRRTAREDQGADRFLAQFSRTRRPTRCRLGSVHRRWQGGGPGGLQVRGPRRDRGLRRAREGRAAEAGQGDQFSLDRARSAAADLQGFPRPRLHRRACRPDRLFVRAAGRRHRASAGPSRGARAQARAAWARA